jgi:hypothetical protein
MAHRLGVSSAQRQRAREDEAQCCVDRPIVGICQHLARQALGLVHADGGQAKHLDTGFGQDREHAQDDETKRWRDDVPEPLDPAFPHLQHALLPERLQQRGHEQRVAASPAKPARQRRARRHAQHVRGKVAHRLPVERAKGHGGRTEPQQAADERLELGQMGRRPVGQQHHDGSHRNPPRKVIQARQALRICPLHILDGQHR